MPETASPPGRKRGREEAADRVGARVASYRKQQDLKVSELARMIDVSPSLISQIERGQSRPSVSTLFALAEALEVPVDAFFAEEAVVGQPASGAPGGGDEAGASLGQAAASLGRAVGGRGQAAGGAGQAADEVERDEALAAGVRHVVRRDGRAAIDIEGGVRWERLTPETLPDVDFLELVYSPGAESHPELYRHPGEEMVLVLSGRLDIIVGFERYELAAGDSIHFPSTFPHRYVNPSDEEARAVTVILHDGKRELPPEDEQRRP